MSRKSKPPPDPEFVIPTLESTVESVNAFNSAIAAGLAADKIAPVKARELTQMARTALASARLEAGLHEMDELRELVRRSEEAAQQRLKTEADGRYGGGGSGGGFGKTELPDDDDDDEDKS